MRRRQFIAGLAGAATWSVAARAQQPVVMRRIGMLQAIAAGDAEALLRLSALQRQLDGLGWKDGHNLQIDHRWAQGGATDIRAKAKDLVSTNPDLIVGVSTPVVEALRMETRSIPILFLQVIDPVAAGFVTSLARPGGNITGITNFEFSMGGKWVQLLKEISPQIARVAVVYSQRPRRSRVR